VKEYAYMLEQKKRKCSLALISYPIKAHQRMDEAMCQRRAATAVACSKEYQKTGASQVKGKVQIPIKWASFHQTKSSAVHQSVLFIPPLSPHPNANVSA
jgi:hypothetical protein